MTATPQNWFAANQSKVQPAGRRPISISRLLSAPYCPKICLMPMAPTKGGRIIGMRTREPRKPLPGKRKRSEMNASGRAMSRARVVVAQASRKEFRSPPR
jgi:hypothetical protein